MTALVRVVAPTEPVLSLEEARAHLKVDAWGSPPVHPDDTYIQACVQAAIDELDGVDGWLGRALVTQTWDLILDAFPEGKIKLPLTSPQLPTSPALEIVESITYIASDGTENVMDAADYRMVSRADPCFVEPVYGTSWPATREVSQAVTIRYVAGYGAASAVPEIIKSYLKLRIGQFYAHREMVIAGATIAPLPFARESLEGVRYRGSLPK